MLVSLALVVSAIVVYFDLTLPANDVAQGIRSEVFSRENFLERQSAAITQVENLIKDYQGEGKFQDTISLALPPEPELSGALAQIHGIIVNNGLTVGGLSFSVSANQNLKGADSGKNSRSGGFVKPIGTVRIQASMSGTYEDLKRFFENLENNIRIFDVTDVSLTPPAKTSGKEGEKTSGKGSPGAYFFNASLVTYYQNL